MEDLKSILKANQAVFVFVGIAFLFDIYGSLTTPIGGGTFGLPSLLIVVYCLGLAILIRLVIARRQVHIALTWVIMFFLYFGWFIVMAFFTDGEPYRPSILFLLCLFGAFTTLRFDGEAQLAEQPEEEISDRN